jgi:hypothetical protein
MSEQQRYKTALWCVYTCYLDTAVFWHPANDSLWPTLQGLVALPQRLKSVERDSSSTGFRFEVVASYPTKVRLWENSAQYHRPPLVEAVWINRRDGLIDSVWAINNTAFSTRRSERQATGRQASFEEQTARRSRFYFNREQPFKALFLKANYQRLPKDLQLLCRERGIRP